MQTLIKNGILYTMTEDKGIFQGDILVEGTHEIPSFFVTLQSEFLKNQSLLYQNERVSY